VDEKYIKPAIVKTELPDKILKLGYHELS